MKKMYALNPDIKNIYYYQQNMDIQVTEKHECKYYLIVTKMVVNV